MRIVISGYYGSKNAGDEAMLAAMIEVFLSIDKKVHITVVSANPDDTKKRHGVAAVGLTDIFAIVGAIRKADILISGGGSLLQNVTSGRSLYYYLGIIFLAHLFNKPVMLYAQGIGPIYGQTARYLMKVLGNKTECITVRDKGSLVELATLGITRPPIKATADPVLAINPVSKEKGKEILTRCGVPANCPLVGLSVREWRGWQHYKDVLRQTSHEIAEKYSAHIVFLPMQFPEDAQTAELIADDSKNCTVLKEEYTTTELLSLVGNMDLIISIRLHALIFAGVMGVPMIGISYDPKIDRFLDSIGERPVGNLQSITKGELADEFERKWTLRDEYRGNNAAMMKKLRELAIENARIAFETAKKP